MVDVEYRNRTISQLVNQLNTLGQKDVAMCQTQLIAIHQEDCTNLVRRFKNGNAQQFFLTDHSSKKYYYQQVSNDLDQSIVSQIQSTLNKGFNVSLIVQNVYDRVNGLLKLAAGWQHQKYVLNCTQFSGKNFQDGITNEKVSTKELQDNLKYYECRVKDVLKWAKASPKTIHVVSLKSLQNYSQLKLVLLPQDLLSTNTADINFSVIKKQLSQLFNYIRMNPSKRFQQISQLLSKRHPTTTWLAQIILYDSANYVINWVCEGSNENVKGRLQFYDKMVGLSNLLKKNDPKQQFEINKIRNKSNNKSETHKTNKFMLKKDKSSQKIQKSIKTTIDLQNISHSPINQLQYCRSLQRKTHKYSILPMDESNNQSSCDLKFKDAIQTVSKFEPQTHRIVTIDYAMVQKQSEALAMLKAEHAVQISQYNQTIQHLNRKLLALAHQQGLDELYTIHERQIMLLEMKIAELRQDITNLIKTGKDDQGYKATIRKLNEQLGKMEMKNTNQKISQGKITMLQKKNKEWKEKYQQSELVRQNLVEELKTVTKRLKIADNELQSMHKQEACMYEGKHNDQILCNRDKQLMSQMQRLIQGIVGGNRNANRFLHLKLQGILKDLGHSRQIILQCNDFLMQLQDHIESKLGEINPSVVLDCNRFIRGFLLNNLCIF